MIRLHTPVVCSVELRRDATQVAVQQYMNQVCTGSIATVPNTGKSTVSFWL